MTSPTSIGSGQQILASRTVRDVVEYSPGQVDEVWCRKIFRQILQSLELQYAMHMPHRPVTPDTIVFHEGGEPLLVPSDLIVPGRKPATLEDALRDDLTALAGVIHYAITGELLPEGPLGGRGYDNYSDSLVAAVDRCMAPDPATRPRTVAEVRDILGIVAPGPAAPGRAGRAVDGPAIVVQRKEAAAPARPIPAVEAPHLPEAVAAAAPDVPPVPETPATSAATVPAGVAVPPDVPVAEPVPVADDIPVVAAVPVAQSAPMPDTARVAEDVPVAQSAPVPDAAPAPEDVPVAQFAPALDAAPVAEHVPVTQAAPVLDAAPAADHVPVMQSAPALDAAPAAEHVPVAQSTPVPHDIPATAGIPALPVAAATPASSASGAALPAGAATPPSPSAQPLTKPSAQPQPPQAPVPTTLSQPQASMAPLPAVQPAGHTRSHTGLGRGQRWALAAGGAAVLAAIALFWFAELRDSTTDDRIALTLPQRADAPASMAAEPAPQAPAPEQGQGQAQTGGPQPLPTPPAAPAPAAAGPATAPQAAVEAVEAPEGADAMAPADGAQPSTLDPAAPGAPARTPAPAAARAAAAAGKASYRLQIQPWGVVYVDGADRGVSPPVKRLELAPGRHTVRVANPNFPDRVLEVDTARGDGRIVVDFTRETP